MKNIVGDSVFSENLLELTTLRESKLVKISYSHHICKAHGCLVLFDNLNVLYDMRSYKKKPLFGHGHPLVIKYASELKQLLIEHSIIQNSQSYEYSFFESENSLTSIQSNEYLFNFHHEGKNHILPNRIFELYPFNLLYKYYKVSLIEGNRLAFIQNYLKDHLKDSLYSIKGCSLTLKNTNNLQKEDFVNFNLFVDESNFMEQNFILYIPITITNTQLGFLTKKIRSIPGAL